MPKVLVIRFSSIGDIVLTSPVVRCLKKQAGAEVHFLTKAAYRSVVASNPYIDKVITIQKKVGEVLPELKAAQYDHIIDLHSNLRSVQVKLALLGAGRSSFDKLNLQKWLLVRLKVDRLPKTHIVDRYLDAARPLGVKNDRQGLDYFIPTADEVDVAEFIASNGAITRTPQTPPAPYTAFVIGAAHATKRLPAERIISWCQKITGPVILLGGPEDKATGETIAAEAGAHVLNACGHLRLHQSASVVRQATLVITHDTGLMHIAAAFKKPIWSVWGNTTPRFGMYPYYPEGMERNRSFEVHGLSCRPCSKIGFPTCPKGHFRCMVEIEMDTPPQLREG